MLAVLGSISSLCGFRFAQNEGIRRTDLYTSVVMYKGSTVAVKKVTRPAGLTLSNAQLIELKQVNMCLAYKW